MIYHCCNAKRRDAVDAHATLNGIDYLEVLDNDAPTGSPRQRTLMLHLLKRVPDDLTVKNVRITGGARIRDPEIDWVAPADRLNVVLVNSELNADEIVVLSAPPNDDHTLIIRTATNGDFSDYCLSLHLNAGNPDSPPVNFDPQLVSVKFSFKVECPSDFDCRSERDCDDEIFAEPDINYLAKDYASFRQLILDRMSYLLPDWKSRRAADLGVTLAELIAYVGDELSYWQDAVATEAYLNTARKRVSLRRHALLVDYRISEGRNARSWLHLEVDDGPFELATDDLEFLTRVDGLKLPDDNRIEPDSKQHAIALQQGAMVFELLQGTRLTDEHNAMSFYTWSDEHCCLTKGATRATLAGHYPELVINDDTSGQYLLFEEVLGPDTSDADDADPAHRQVVRLTRVLLGSDPLNNQDITHIYWANEDALTFPLCLSNAAGAEVSIARGNIVLVDHGETIRDENLGAVPEPWLYFPADKNAGGCDTEQGKAIPPRFRPRLQHRPLTHGAGAPAADEPASTALTPTLEKVTPRVLRLQGDLVTDSHPWFVQPDLLNSDDTDRHVVVEMDNDGVASLRFGDDSNGARPESGTDFTIDYRVGNGMQGNVGVDSIRHIVSLDGRVLSVRNPLPAQGGLVAETPAQIRRRAPQAFRTQLRAVTSDDYAYFTGQQQGVQQAAARLRWTGSWHTQTITLDRDGGVPLDATFESTIAGELERYRMAGHDLNYRDPVFVSLQLEMQICVSREYFRSDVEQALLAIFNSGLRPDGSPALFHPDNFSFGQTIYLSPFYAEARSIAGVSSVQITRFTRQGDDDPKPLQDGFMQMGQLEIARLDNDPNFPENGVLKLTMLGGK